MRLLVRQSMILAVVWSASGITYLLLNLDGLAALWIPTLLAIVFGGTAAATLSLLLTQRSLRPIMLAASQGSEGLVAAPGVLSRLVGTWLLGSGLPCLAIAGLVLTRSNGWIIQKTGSIETPILMVTLVAILDRASGDDHDGPVDFGSGVRGRRCDGARRARQDRHGRRRLRKV